jgi:hypothetical protein
VPWPDHSHPAPRPKDADFDAAGIPALFPPFAWYQSRAGARVTRRVWIRGDALRVVEEQEERRECWTLPLPAGSARSRGAVLVELDGRDADEPLFFMAPEAGELWLVTAEVPPRILPRPLPEGDRPQGIVYVEVAEGEHRLAVDGRSRDWLSSGDGWEAASPASSASAPTLTVLDPDPLRPEVELRLAEGPSLRHRYGLGRPRELLLAGWAVLGALMRPPPFALLGAGTDYAAVAAARPDEALLVLDPLLGGGYAWLLAPNLLLHAILMDRARRVLRRRGISSRRAAGWVAATFLAGVFAGPVIWALESRRAWQRPAAGARPAMLVHVA